tara:strand:- start:49320 stop:50216 length:897 start_codon:yes stop_codon:yes gene_type:complete
MTLRLGILGMSPGNGHPYSWSAICNGYDSLEMADCGFPVIPEYLAERQWPDDCLPDVQVTHVWAQDRAKAEHIARAALIDHVVATPEEMIGKIDALLLARDDAKNHFQLAAPFLKAGLPVYIDKPLALSETNFDLLHGLETRPGQIFSCSALRFSQELRLDASAAKKIGEIHLVQAMTPKYWSTYAIHLIDPLLMMLGHEQRPERLFAGQVGLDGRILGLRYKEGPDVHLMATGTRVPSPLEIRVVGSRDEVTLRFSDSFGAFKEALAEFVMGVREGHSRTSKEFNRRAVQIIEMGIE